MATPSSTLNSGDGYNILHKIGQGAQGIILKARDKAGGFVAIKKLRNSSDSNGISMDTIREIYMLRELNHKNIINIVDIFGKADHLYIIMPFAVGDLEQLIQRKDVLLTPGHIKQYMSQILAGVEYIHNKFILHRDLKPSNLLIEANNTLRISDFGLAREYGSPNRLLSFQACTVWYRAPELLFGGNQYGTGLDMWSVGAIFGELMLRVPMFGGNDNTDIAQLGRIFRILGTPNYVEQDTVAAPHLNWKDCDILPKFRRFEPNRPYPVENLLKAESSSAKTLLLSMCKLDPNHRISATQALKHTYFEEKPLPTPIHLLPNPQTVITNNHAAQP